jgi:hypothetical protein
MSVISLSGLGPEIKNQIGISPAAPVAGTVNGTGVDRMGFNACVLEVDTGASTGTPGSLTLDVKLQHSDVIGSGYADYVPGVAGSGAVAQITAINSRKRKSIDLRGAKRYVRAVAVTAFVGGTAPTLFQCTKLILAGADTLPAQADD